MILGQHYQKSVPRHTAVGQVVLYRQGLVGAQQRPGRVAKGQGHEASKTRVVRSLKQTTIFHGPARLAKPSSSAVAESSASAPPGAVKNFTYSPNWSGYAAFGGAASYGPSSFYFIINDMVVPVAERAFGNNCSGGWDWGSEWNGIDGWGSAYVLQAGVEFDAYCANLTLISYYSARYERFPYGEVRFSNFPVTAGDDIFVEVWHTSPTQGYAYLVN